ncbi:MAG: cadmium-translocating P-type ATPase [Thermotogaceae bacterium]|jgi:Cu+-exporting ATPase|nr:cadmium-translocating P-type ATPase [Thermotogaceae bacterium]
MKEYVVKGMTCAACVRAVEKAASKVEGVSNPVVNLSTEKLTFELSGDFDEEKLFNFVKKAGYELEEVSKERIVTLEIDGMTCAACVSAVKKAVAKLEGVSEVSVNLATERATVKYDPDKLRISSIKEAIEKAGYRASAFTNSDSEQSRLKKEAAIKSYKQKFLVSIVFAIPLLIIAMGHMTGLKLPSFIDPHMNPLNFALVQLFLTLPIIIAGRDFYLKGIPNLFRGHPNMDTLVGLGTGAAFIYGVFATVQIASGNHNYAGDLYFESAGVIIALISLGKYFENLSRGKTSEAIRKLMNLAPKKALVKREERFVEIPLEEVEAGDVLLVKAGMSIPVDGTVIDGTASVDQSMLTGESIPVDVGEGSKVTGGTVNINGAIEIRASRVGSDTVLSKIIKMVEEAQASKAPIARLADTVSGYFVPFVLVVALVTFVSWIALGYGFTFSMSMTIAVLVIACPCALGLATPTAIMVATGRGAGMGILFKNGEALETTHKVDAVIFDKTGTITRGKPQLVDFKVLNGFTEKEAARLVASIASRSSHPLDRAILDGYEGDLLQVSDFQAVAGGGISATINGGKVKLGNPGFIGTTGKEVDEFVRSLSELGKTPVVASYDGKAMAVLGIADVIKDSSARAIEKLKRSGVETYMMTGDNERTARAIAAQVGVDRVIAEVMPQHKAEKVGQLKEKGFTVAMVGDGINDSPALAAADVGIAIGSGTDIAIEAADVVLMKDDLNDVVNSINLSKATIRNIKQNLFWAFFYNTIGIPVAAGLFYTALGLRLNPMIAGAAMAFSSVSVVTNALRLKRIKI